MLVFYCPDVCVCVFCKTIFNDYNIIIREFKILIIEKLIIQIPNLLHHKIIHYK